MKLCHLVQELQTMNDKYGECEVEIANDNNDILDSYTIDRICFFKDGENQRVIIIEQ